MISLGLSNRVPNNPNHNLLIQSANLRLATLYNSNIDYYDNVTISFKRQLYHDTIKYAKISISNNYNLPGSYYYWAHSLIELGDSNKSLKIFEKCLNLYKDSINGSYLSYMGMARAYVELGLLDKAMGCLEKSMAIYENYKKKDDLSLAYYYLILGKLYQVRGDYNSSIGSLKNAYTWYLDKGYTDSAANVMGEMGYVSLLLGDMENGILYTIKSNTYAVDHGLNRLYRFNLINWIIYSKCKNMNYRQLEEEVREYIIVNHDGQLQKRLNSSLGSECL